MRTDDRETGAPAGGAWVALIATRMPSRAADRVRFARRMEQAGALALRPGVYALPDEPPARAELAQAGRELARGRGAALPGVIAWLDARAARALRELHDARAATRRSRLVAHIACLERVIARQASARPAARQTAGARLARLRRTFERLPGNAHAEPIASARPPARNAAGSRGPAWVTRRGVRVDRIASAWFVRRFVDAGAQFRFVAGREDVAPGEIGFDMPGVEFTHEGGRCTFEGLAARYRPQDAAVRAMAEIVHDLDIQDGRFGRAETPGVGKAIDGLAALEPDDGRRLSRGAELFEMLYASFAPGRPPRPSR
jgi:hypothetical protein